MSDRTAIIYKAADLNRKMCLSLSLSLSLQENLYCYERYSLVIWKLQKMSVISANIGAPEHMPSNEMRCKFCTWNIF